MAEKVRWTAIVLTCANRQWANTLQTELEIRQAKGLINKDVLLLTVEDPKSSVGSGGATINALLTVTEYLSAQRGYSIINPDVLQESKVLILHCGRNYPYEPCGRAFITLPASLTSPEYDGMTCHLDLLLKNLTEKLAVKSPPGVWVSSTDMILSIPENAAIPWTNSDVCVITVPSTPKYCRNHGVYKINTEGYVTDILYQKDLGGLEHCERPDGTVPVVCSVIYLSHAVTEALLSFHVKPPLDACTYMGVDNGQPPIQLSLFFDVMLPMTSDVNEKEFVSGGRSGVKGQAHVPGSDDMIKTMRSARQILWRELHNFKIWACMVERGEFHYLVSCPLDHEAILLDCPYKDNFHSSEITWQDVKHSLVQDKCKVEDDAILINSILCDKVVVSSKSIITDCHLGGRMEVGRGCLITGLSIENQLKTNLKKTVKIGDYTVVQCFRIYLSTLGKMVQVLTTHGKFDRVESMDILDLTVPPSERESIEDDMKLAWVEGGMPCPVAECGNRLLRAYFAMLRHWAEVHARTVQRINCPRCTYFHIRRNQVVRHVRHVHKMDSAEAARLIVSGTRVPNICYVPPGRMRIPVKARNEPSEVQALEDSELLQYVDDEWH